MSFYIIIQRILIVFMYMFYSFNLQGFILLLNTKYFILKQEAYEPHRSPKQRIWCFEYLMQSVIEIGAVIKVIKILNVFSLY